MGAPGQTSRDGPSFPSANARPPQGRVERGLPFGLESHNPVSIGSAPDCDIVIDGADAHHAELRWENGGWILRDDPAPLDTFVNGRSVDAKRLDPGDWMEIAGVRIRYDGESLEEIPSGAPVGLRVSVRHVSAGTGGKNFLQDVTFEAVPGSFTAILGPSGCGKSTLIQRLAGLETFEGDIRFNGHALAAEKEDLLPLLAYLPQAVEDTLHGDMKVGEAVENFVRIYLGPDALSGGDARFGRKFDDVGLSWNDLRGKAVRELSGGQKRRLALLLALLREPQLLLLDEPTAGLDPAAASGIMGLLRHFADQGRTVLCATHVLGQLELCDGVLVLAPGGRQAFHGSPRDALDHFGAAGWLDVYHALSEGTWRPQLPAAADPPVAKDLPSPPPPVTFGNTFAGTFLRLLHGVRHGWNWVLFLGIPVGVAGVLAWACKPMFADWGKWSTVCFCMAVAVFWLGLSGSVRSLVTERVPRRCLDRMRGMPLAGYFAAHAAFAAVSAFVQATLFAGVVFGFRPDGGFSSGALPAFAGILGLTAFAGGCVGLFVSAVSKKELHAVWTLPLVAILALFLSEPVLGEDPDGQVLHFMERAMPTFHTQKCMEGELERFQGSDAPNAGNWRRFLGLAAGYPVVFLPLAFFFQNRREKEWNGR